MKNTNMNADTLTSDEYEYQYFGLSSTMFSKLLRGSLQRYVEKGLKDMEAQLIECCVNENDKSNFRRDIEVGTQRFKELSKQQLLQFEPEVKKIFKIPDNVLLPEDACHKNQLNEEEILKLEKEIEDLEKELIKEKTFQCLCNKELDNIKKIEPVCRTVEEVMKTLDDVKKLKSHQRKLAKLDSAHDDFLAHYQKNINGGNLNYLLQSSKFVSKK